MPNYSEELDALELVLERALQRYRARLPSTQVYGHPETAVNLQEPQPPAPERDPAMPTTASTLTPEYRWLRVSDEWVVTGPDANIGDVLTVHRSNGTTSRQRVTRLAGKHHGVQTYRTTVVSEIDERIDRVVAQSTPTPGPAPREFTVQENRVYVTNDDRIVRVRRSRGTRNLYAQAWSQEVRRWEYAPGAIGRIVRHLTAQEAADFGHLNNRCVFCHHRLTDDRSTTIGYGPVCADNYGLPWGANR